MSNAVARRKWEFCEEPPVQELADLDAAVLGAGLPLAAEMCITQAGLMRQDVDAAQALLEQAYALAPRHPATLIALYRFHFYGNRLSAAREVAVLALALAADLLNLPTRWQETERAACFQNLQPLPRFYLFTLKGLAYLNLRLGDLEQGRVAIQKLQELDPKDVVGHGVLAVVLARMGRDDVGYEDCPDIAGSRVLLGEAAT